MSTGKKGVSEGEKKVRAALEASIKTMTETLLPLFEDKRLRNPFDTEDGKAAAKPCDQMEKDGKTETPASALSDAKKELGAAASRLEKMSAACKWLQFHHEIS